MIREVRKCSRLSAVNNKPVPLVVLIVQCCNCEYVWSMCPQGPAGNKWYHAAWLRPSQPPKSKTWGFGVGQFERGKHMSLDHTEYIHTTYMHIFTFVFVPVRSRWIVYGRLLRRNAAAVVSVA